MQGGAETEQGNSTNLWEMKFRGRRGTESESEAGLEEMGTSVRYVEPLKSDIALAKRLCPPIHSPCTGFQILVELFRITATWVVDCATVALTCAVKARMCAGS